MSLVSGDAVLIKPNCPCELEGDAGGVKAASVSLPEELLLEQTLSLSPLSLLPCELVSNSAVSCFSCGRLLPERRRRFRHQHRPVLAARRL